MKIFTALIMSGLMLACGPQSNPYVNSDDNSSASNQHTDNTTPGDRSNLPNDNNTSNNRGHLTDAWVSAPSALCDDPSNLAYVENIKDGDTIKLAGLHDGGEIVRYIGVDAPETHKSECWSYEAEAELTAMMPAGQPVCLLKDSNSSPKDKYNRLLRYVFIRIDGKWVMQNTRMVRLGAAKAYHQFLKGKDYKQEFLSAEYDAIEEGQGGWTNCGWDK